MKEENGGKNPTAGQVLGGIQRYVFLQLDYLSTSKNPLLVEVLKEEHEKVFDFLRSECFILDHDKSFEVEYPDSDNFKSEYNMMYPLSKAV